MNIMHVSANICTTHFADAGCSNQAELAKLKHAGTLRPNPPIVMIEPRRRLRVAVTVVGTPSQNPRPSAGQPVPALGREFTPCDVYLSLESRVGIIKVSHRMRTFRVTVGWAYSGESGRGRKNYCNGVEHGPVASDSGRGCICCLSGSGAT